MGFAKAMPPFSRKERCGGVLLMAADVVMRSDTLSPLQRGSQAAPAPDPQGCRGDGGQSCSAYDCLLSGCAVLVRY